MVAMCMKLTRPGVLEIKGPYPSSPLFYVRSETLQGFVVNNRASTIELLFVSGFPSKIIDFSSGQLANAVDLLTDFVSQKPVSTIVNERAEALIRESRRRDTIFDAKELDERLSYVESVLNTVPTIQQETSTLSASVQQIYELSTQLRNDLDAMKNEDAITELECEDDDCHCECQEKANQPLTKEEYIEEPVENNATEASGLEIFIASVTTAFIVIGITVMSIPYIKM